MKLLAMALFFYSGPLYALKPCPGNEVMKIDIKNLQIANPQSSKNSLIFKNGVATEKLDPGDISPEWEYTITKDEVAVISTTPKKFRVLTINRNHTKGSGNTNLFIVFSCENSQIEINWPVTEMNSIDVTHGNIAYETQGEYRGAQPPGPGKRFVLEWNQDRKLLEKKTDCPPSYPPLKTLCKNISYAELPPDLKVVLREARCQSDEGGNQFQMSDHGPTAYNVCCRPPPHGPCSSRIWSKMSGSWKDLARENEVFVFGSNSKSSCENFYLLLDTQSGFHSFCQGNRVFRFLNGKYSTN